MRRAFGGGAAGSRRTGVPPEAKSWRLGIARSAEGGALLEPGGVVMRSTMRRLCGRLPALTCYPVVGLLAGALAGGVFGTAFGVLWAVTHLELGAALGAPLYFALAGAL